MSHGSMTKAGKVRDLTNQLGVVGKERKKRFPRTRLKHQYEKRIIKGEKFG